MIAELKSLPTLVLLATALVLPASGAIAQKAQFQRSKLHVNVGTIDSSKDTSRALDMVVEQPRHWRGERLPVQIMRPRLTPPMGGGPSIP